MSCNEKREVAGLASELFQSLSGFPMSCNGTSRSAWGPAALFQSLSGFPMSCNRADREHRHDGRHVSIPIGFSNELQQYQIGEANPYRNRFNPYRVFQ